MIEREKVLKGLECCSATKCEECPYRKTIGCITNMIKSTLELLKNEPNAPTVTAPTSPTYFRLMAIKDELETENKTLKEDVKELRRLTGSLTNLCENLLRRIATDETARTEVFR